MDPLRVLYGAAHHMTRARLRCTSWMGFLDAINAAASSNNMLASLVNLDFAVKILRHLYGARPLVILADEVGRSDDEGLIRNRLCQLMDSWAGQVYVVMSALSDYEGVVDTFNESKRKSFKSCLCEELTRQVVLTLDRQQKQHRSASAWLESHCLLCPRRVPDSAPAKLKPPVRWFWRHCGNWRNGVVGQA